MSSFNLSSALQPPFVHTTETSFPNETFGSEILGCSCKFSECKGMSSYIGTCHVLGAENISFRSTIVSQSKSVCSIFCQAKIIRFEACHSRKSTNPIHAEVKLKLKVISYFSRAIPPKPHTTVDFGPQMRIASLRCLIRGVSLII